MLIHAGVALALIDQGMEFLCTWSNNQYCISFKEIISFTPFRSDLLSPVFRMQRLFLVYLYFIVLKFRLYKTYATIKHRLFIDI